MKITIPNFSKFNPRNDLKSMPWLRLQNDFYDKEDFFDQDINTTWLFIFLLCQCAQKVSETIEMDEKYLVAKSKLKKNEFYAALNRLSSKSLILLNTNGCDRISTDSCLTNEHNEHNEHNERTERTNGNEQISSKSTTTSDCVNEILAKWNNNAPDHGMPVVKTLSPQRLKKLKLAMKQFPEPKQWGEIFAISATKGFTGKDGREFIPNWDYVFRNENYISFYEEFHSEQTLSHDDALKQVEALFLAE